MTREEFIIGYALRSGLSDEWRALGYIQVGDRYMLAMPCSCGEEGCEGWAMTSPDNLDAHLSLYAPEKLRDAYNEATKCFLRRCFRGSLKAP